MSVNHTPQVDLEHPSPFALEGFINGAVPSEFSATPSVTRCARCGAIASISWNPRMPLGVGLCITDPASRVRVEPNPKWIRGMLDGRVVVDSRAVRSVWEVPHYPAWYFPLSDVAATLVVGGTTILDAAWRHLESPVEALHDLVRIEWNAMDAWFEENVEVFVHPRSPEVRVDALPSSRHVRVRVDGEVVADSTNATVVFETGLPARYYLPKSDVRMDLHRPRRRSGRAPDDQVR